MKKDEAFQMRAARYFKEASRCFEEGDFKMGFYYAAQAVHCAGLAMDNRFLRYCCTKASDFLLDVMYFL